MSGEEQEAVLYAFSHLVGSFYTDDAHSADSADLARDVMQDLGLTSREMALMELLAEQVHGNYDYTGKTDDLLRRIERGEV